MKKILLIIGTRPEAIKMAPVVKAINSNHPEISLKTLSTGQHNSSLQDGLSGFNITIDKNLRIENLLIIMLLIKIIGIFNTILIGNIVSKLRQYLRYYGYRIQHQQD